MQHNETFFFPNVLQLFSSTSIIPTKSMSIESRMNTITRLILVFTALTFVCSGFDTNVLFGALLAISVVIVIFNMSKNNAIESFQLYTQTLQPTKVKSLEEIELETEISGFANSTKKNPFTNLLLPEINRKPIKKPAPPAYIDAPVINQKTKQMVQTLNPDIQVNRDLYGDVSEKFEFEQSQRQFYSTSNTMAANDQGAFADWLYGDMPSAKEGDPLALLRDNERYILR